MPIMQIMAFVFLVAGFGTVFAAKQIVKRFELEKNAKCNFEHELSEEELAEYKQTKATVNVKMIGMLIALPGIILVILAFK